MPCDVNLIGEQLLNSLDVQVKIKMYMVYGL
jgi:hypothetical protein